MEGKSIILDCIAGNSRAQRIFYDKYVSYLRLTSLQYATDLPMAKDILQEAFIKIFNNLHKLEMDRKSPLPWMRRIVINEAIRMQKTNLKKQLHEQEVASNNDNAIIEDTLYDLELSDLMNIIRRLPYNYKVVFLLKEIDGYSHKEISNMLQIKEATSRTVLTRSKLKLQALVNSMYSKDLFKS